jgi:CTP:molybdopterin cytidylyltransferase MocA
MLVLAAGRGERMGGPKAWLLIDGHPLAWHHAPCVLVTSPDIAAPLQRPDVTVVTPDRPHHLGPAGSIGAAVRARVLDERVVITPVDVLPAPPARIAALLAALDTHPAARSFRGHPVSVRRSVLEEHYLTGDPILRDVLDGLACARLEPDEAGVLPDLDTPEDVVRVTGFAPRFMR